MQCRSIYMRIFNIRIYISSLSYPLVGILVTLSTGISKEWYSSYDHYFTSISYIASIFLIYSKICLLLYPFFLKSENNTSIFTGVTHIRLSGDSIFFNVSIGIFLILACSLYLSENGSISQLFP